MNLQTLLPSYSEQPKGNYAYRFTIFTPVYNRANTLKRVFESLENQTFKDFELVIINDGSTDNSHETIETLLKTATFPVNYVNNAINKHKMACFFQAINLAQGEFILPFDSDDACVPEALELLNKEYEEIPADLKPRISGVTCLCEDQNGNLVGKAFEKQPYYSNTFMSQREHLEATEKWGFTKTDVLKSIHINEAIFAKGYIPEGIIWELLANQGFKTKYVNHILRIYYLDTENAISIQNHKKDAFGMAIYSLCILNWFYSDYFMKYPTLFIKRILTLLRAAIFLDLSLKSYTNAINSTLLKTLFILGWPFKKLLKNT
ncbi:MULTISPECIES: glycosyltransferase family 2 protein [Bizionia]|uniref:Glycosyltransferase family 2 protein n=1 Tax=Bizionia algoritergicola TaxID=291187 RepID=A0A5D0QYV8_9FLAO|nr:MULTISPECIES: glycosyltransferase family 2 protein [Bizionia]OBX24138.1 glycosyltransferase [Bizionia sp. APA-3]TYB73648.1 glycosyltransferase family 2 protein [Bizionia algoritergicola]